MDAKTAFALLQRVDSKLDKLDSRLDSIDVRLAEYNSDLEFHIARTNQIEDQLLPIVKHVEQLRGVAKFIALIAAAITFVVSIWAIKK